MARARNIKPSIMDNEDLAELGGLTRLLFVYMWMLADREGRLEDRPKRIGAKALPYDRDADIDAMLDDLMRSGFIVRYVAGGKACIQINSFVKHQKPHQNETASELPSVEEADPKAEVIPVDAQGLSPLVEVLAAKAESTSLLSSVSLNPSSLNPGSLDPPNPPAPATPSPPPGFDAFWRMYPNTGRKVDKAKCLKAWRKDGLEPRADEVVAHVRAMCQTQQWLTGYEPAPLTYLNGRRYEDPVPRAGPRNESRAYLEETLNGARDGAGGQAATGHDAGALRRGVPPEVGRLYAPGDGGDLVPEVLRQGDPSERGRAAG